MLSKSIIAVAAMAASVVAQTTSNYTVAPGSVDPQLSASWCIGQRSACGTLCSGDAPTNDCDPTALTYSCLCEDGDTPPLDKYMNTLPYYLCQTAYSDCITAHPNDALGQTKCKTDIQNNCGTLDIANFTAEDTSSSTSSSAAPETTVAPSKTANADAATTTESAAPSATSSSAALALAAGKEVGMGVFAAGILGAFGYML